MSTLGNIGFSELTLWSKLTARVEELYQGERRRLYVDGEIRPAAARQKPSQPARPRARMSVARSARPPRVPSRECLPSLW